MKFVIAPDSFKESLTAADVCKAIEKGIRSVFPKAEVVSLPMADGGEGTSECILESLGGSFRSRRVTGPLGNQVSARYGLADRGQTAIIEMAQASGLTLVPPAKRNPLVTTSLGSGELIRNALELGCKKVILTLGGVATNDAGAGIAQALGYRLLTSDGRPVPAGAAGLKSLSRIDSSQVHPRLKKTSFVAACDVKNPLCGAHGSAAIYGPQKGATPKMIPQIDRALRHFAEIVKRDLNRDVLNVPGSGAAGGAGAGALAFLNATLKRGIEVVIEVTQLEKKMRDADLVVTAEGQIDGQVRFGKTAAGIARLAKKFGIPVIAFCGRIGPGGDQLSNLGIDAVFPIADGPISYEESVRKAPILLEKSARQVFRFYKCISKCA